MARVFSLPTVLRQVPNSLLCSFFDRLQIPFPELDWSQLRERDIAPILRVLHDLSNDEMVPVENELRTVHEMACEAGLQALIETAASLGDHGLAERMPAEQSPYGRAMWV